MRGLARVVTRDAGVCRVPKALKQRTEIHINRLNDDPAVYKVDEIPVAWKLMLTCCFGIVPPDEDCVACQSSQPCRGGGARRTCQLPCTDSAIGFELGLRNERTSPKPRWN